MAGCKRCVVKNRKWKEEKKKKNRKRGGKNGDLKLLFYMSARAGFSYAQLSCLGDIKCKLYLE